MVQIDVCQLQSFEVCDGIFFASNLVCVDLQQCLQELAQIVRVINKNLKQFFDLNRLLPNCVLFVVE